jgi:hypothetical protein
LYHNDPAMEVIPMGEVAVLTRTLLHRTRWGTAIFHDRRQGLLARDPAGRWRAISAEELRKGYPEAFAAWQRLAGLLPGRAGSAWVGPTGGTAA